MKLQKVIKLLLSETEDDIRLGWSIITHSDNMPDLRTWMIIFSEIDQSRGLDSDIMCELFKETFGDQYLSNYLFQHYYCHS